MKNHTLQHLLQPTEQKVEKQLLKERAKENLEIIKREFREQARQRRKKGKTGLSIHIRFVNQLSI